jgi:hypothetical protein
MRERWRNVEMVEKIRIFVRDEDVEMSDNALLVQRDW